MLTGKELGAALGAAMAAKQVTQKALAFEFGVQQPSVSEWLKSGRIHKKHLVHLVEFFASHMGPQHWGLPEHWAPSVASSSSAEAKRQLSLLYEALPPAKQLVLLAVARALASSPN